MGFDLKRFMKLGGSRFNILRNDKLITETDGLPNTEKSTNQKYIGFYPNTDIQPGDWLKNKISGDKFYILDIYSDVVKGEVFQIKAYYLTETQYKKEQESNNKVSSQTFNISNANGSIIGNQTHANINNTYSFEEIKKLIVDKASNPVNKEKLKEMVNLLETLIENNQVIQKGSLSKFKDLLQKNSWLTGPLAGLFLKWLF